MVNIAQLANVTHWYIGPAHARISIYEIKINRSINSHTLIHTNCQYIDFRCIWIGIYNMFVFCYSVRLCLPKIRMGYTLTWFAKYPNFPEMKRSEPRLWLCLVDADPIAKQFSIASEVPHDTGFHRLRLLVAYCVVPYFVSVHANADFKITEPLAYMLNNASLYMEGIYFHPTIQCVSFERVLKRISTSQNWWNKGDQSVCLRIWMRFERAGQCIPPFTNVCASMRNQHISQSMPTKHTI